MLPLLVLTAFAIALPCHADEFILAGSGTMTLPSGELKEFTCAWAKINNSLWKRFGYWICNNQLRCMLLNVAEMLLQPSASI